MTVSRKEFLQWAGVVALGSALVNACASPEATSDGGTDGGDPDAGHGTVACTQGAKATAITSNHGHALTIAQADLTAGAAATYGIQGTASHSHDVVLTGPQLDGLARSGTPVTVTSSSTLGHTHDVTLGCA